MDLSACLFGLQSEINGGVSCSSSSGGCSYVDIFEYKVEMVPMQRATCPSKLRVRQSVCCLTSSHRLTITCLGVLHNLAGLPLALAPPYHTENDDVMELNPLVGSSTVSDLVLPTYGNDVAPRYFVPPALNID